MLVYRLSSLMYFDWEAVLEGGQAVEFGSPAELLEDVNNQYSKLYNSSVSE